MFSTLANDSKFSNLCLSKDNWPKWSQKILEVMEMSEMDDYLLGNIPKPDPTTDPALHKCWKGNNKKVVGFLKAYVEDREKTFVTTENAHVAWKNLVDCHEKQGPITQVRLIQEVLSIYYPKDVAGWSATTDRIRDICTRIFAQAVPTFDVLFMVAMLNALEREVDHIQSEMTSHYISNATATSAALLNRIEQEIVYKTRREGPSDIALAIRPRKSFAKPKKICGNPNCKRTGHTTPKCFQPGGAMEGRKDEVLAAKAKAREERNRSNPRTNPNPAGIRHDNSGRAYIVDSETGEAILLAAVEIDPKPATDVALAALSTDPIPRAWYGSMSAADQYEYHALFLDDHSASVDWNERRRTVPADALFASSPNTNSRTKLSVNAGPFILDSGASIHITPDSSDFYDLKPIPPRSIKGIRGSSINATGIGKIRLYLSKGNTIILDPALYVPEVAVRLISVLVLGSGPQKLVSHFDGDGCWLTNRSGTTVASGRISPISRWLYSIDIGTPLVEHSFIATRVPDLETWHRRLGHVNYQSIVDMSDKDMAKGMHINLSSAPPKCQSCILGKQTRLSVPKICKGQRAEGVLDCVYIDLTGPQSVQSAAGNSYVMNMIDNAASFCWAIPIPHKSSTIKHLKVWVLQVERETGCTVGIFNIDNGELKSTEFVEFCASRGIKPRWTSPHTSAQNGRVERAHYTLFDSARTMRIAASLPPNRWDEFIITANYLHMLVPTKSLNNKTPFEAYHQRKPDVSHLREIGCRAFVLILNKHNPKVFQRSEECVLIGYGKDSKSYRCYHRATHKVFESYHVVFIESKDDCEAPFRPGVTQGMDDDEPTSSNATPAPNPILGSPPVTLPSPTLITPPILHPSSAPSPPASMPLPPPRRTTRIPVASFRSAKASGIHKTSPVECAVRESIASKTRLEQHRPPRSRTSSNNNNTTILSPPDFPGPSTPPDSAELAFMTLADLPCSQTESIMEQLCGDGFEWGLNVNATGPEEPCTMEEAMASPDAPKWLAACNEEIASIEDLGVFRLVPCSTANGRKIMDGKFVFRIKRDENGNAIRWKARFVAKGYSAVYGVDYTDTMAPTMRMETFRVVTHVAAVRGWELHQVDIVTTFLRGKLEPGEEVYMKQPKGFEAKGKEDHIWELLKGLYGLPQGSHIWNKTMNAGMASLGFTRISCEYCLYFWETESGSILTGIHVDDFLMAVSSLLEASSFKTELSSIWEIKDLGEAKFCVGVAIERDLINHHIYLSQTALIDKILEQFNMINCNPVSTPMESGLVLSRHSDITLTAEQMQELRDLPYRRLVGLLMYLAIATRPDIAFAVGKLSQFLAFYNFLHWLAAKRILRYLKGTRTLRLKLGGTVLARISSFSDASHACCPDTGRSIGAYCFSLGDTGMISWASSKRLLPNQLAIPNTWLLEKPPVSACGCEILHLQLVSSKQTLHFSSRTMMLPWPYQKTPDFTLARNISTPSGTISVNVSTTATSKLPTSLPKIMSPTY